MKKILIVLAFLVVISGLFIVLKDKDEKAPEANSNSNNQQTNKNTESFDKSKYSIDDPSSVWIVVNKKRPIPTTFTPDGLMTPNVRRDSSDSDSEQQVRQEVGSAIESMFADSKKEGLDLMLASGYRSAALQKTYYDGYVARDGQAAADRYSARPGTSEHQTGLAFDVARSDRKCYLEICFTETAEGKWLAANAYKYGLILRYQNGKEDITGYQYEPWHFRYVGAELAEQINKSGQTLEEFFEL